LGKCRVGLVVVPKLLGSEMSEEERERVMGAQEADMN
jgi:hypothetical protein